MGGAWVTGGIIGLSAIVGAAQWIPSSVPVSPNGSRYVHTEKVYNTIVPVETNPQISDSVTVADLDWLAQLARQADFRCDSIKAALHPSSKSYKLECNHYRYTYDMDKGGHWVVSVE